MRSTQRAATLARVAGDLLLGLLLAGAVVFTAVALAATWGGASWIPGMIVGTVTGTLALLRRRHRFGTAIAGVGVAAAGVVVAWLARLPVEPAPATALALAVLVASAVRVLPSREAVTISGAGLVVVGGSFLVSSTSSLVIPIVNAVTWLAALAAGLLGRLLMARREAMAERVRQDERLAIARELHDVVAHHVTGIVVQAQAAQIALRAGTTGPAALPRSLAGIEEAGVDALGSLRRVVGLLRDDDAAPVTYELEGLRALVARFEIHGPDVHLRLHEDRSGWPPEVTTAVYRVVQESLTNVTRHAPLATSVSVAVERGTEGVGIEVTDDIARVVSHDRTGSWTPREPEPGPGSGYGLIGMRERVEALGGTLKAGPRDHGGWTVRATVPLPEDWPR